MKRLLFIYNPYAGQGKIGNDLAYVVDLFTKAGYEVTAYPTQKHGDATNKVADRAGSFDLLVCSGGDGTLDEVVTGMMRCKKKIPIGYIPAGSTNDFAASVMIPSNIKKAAELVINGRVARLDMGSFNDDIFVYIAAFGAFTDVSYDTDQALKNTFGRLAYLLEGIRHISEIKPYEMRIEYDGNVLEDSFIFGMISNSLSVGGMKRLVGPRVMLDDGSFEVTLIRSAVEINNYNEVAYSIRTGKKNPLVLQFKAKNMKITSESRIPWTLDGEFGGSFREVILNNIQRALKIIVPDEVRLPFSGEMKLLTKKDTVG